MNKIQVEYKSLPDLLAHSAKTYSSKPLFYFPDDNLKISYEAFYKLTSKAANLMSQLGIKKGDRVSVMLPNIIEFPVLWMSIARLGAIMVPTNNSYKSSELKYILDNSEARLIFIDKDSYPTLNQIRSECPKLEHVVVVGGDAPPETYKFSAMMEAAADSYNGINPDLDDLVNIQYTSGTTGFPKGCMLSHKYWLQFGQVASDYLEIRKDDRDLSAQPFYYIDPQWNTILCMMNGIALVVMKRFSASRHWKVCNDFDVTFFYCVGTMPVYLANKEEDPVNEQNHKLRAVICSGIPQHMHAYFEKRWNVPWREAFGMTETGVDLMVPLGDTESVGSGAMGRPTPYKEAKIVNDSGNPVPRGKTGQLVVRGEPMMKGYWNNSTATAEVMKAGWLYTGDLAFEDEKNYFHWVGRIKDMIRRGGENISSFEVENVLSEHPIVKVAAVIPVPDSLKGEEVKAYLVLKEGESRDAVSLESIIDYANQKLSAFKVPRYIEFRDDLPRTPSERVEKHRLNKEKSDLRADSYDTLDKIWR